MIAKHCDKNCKGQKCIHYDYVNMDARLEEFCTREVEDCIHKDKVSPILKAEVELIQLVKKETAKEVVKFLKRKYHKEEIVCVKVNDLCKSILKEFEAKDGK